jgi:hypothetical protein
MPVGLSGRVWTAERRSLAAGASSQFESIHAAPLTSRGPTHNLAMALQAEREKANLVLQLVEHSLTRAGLRDDRLRQAAVPLFRCGCRPT